MSRIKLSGLPALLIILTEYIASTYETYILYLTCRFRGFSVDSMLKGLMLPSGLTVSIYNPDEIKVLEFKIIEHLDNNLNYF